MKFVRYRDQGKVAYGILEGDHIRELAESPFPNLTKRTADSASVETGRSRKLSSVELLWPCEPSKMLAVGLNYKSHLEAQKRTAPKNPEIFYKPASALLEPNGKIKMPAGAQNVHYEGELVIGSGRKPGGYKHQASPYLDSCEMT
jgi:2-keto-4-pentenoate hydratase/2-oxohepta-3-ene-1,7-dioic acid hydratase in catechol pathway